MNLVDYKYKLVDDGTNAVVSFTTYLGEMVSREKLIPHEKSIQVVEYQRSQILDEGTMTFPSDTPLEKILETLNAKLGDVSKEILSCQPIPDQRNPEKNENI